MQGRRLYCNSLTMQCNCSVIPKIFKRFCNNFSGYRCVYKIIFNQSHILCVQYGRKSNSKSKKCRGLRPPATPPIKKGRVRGTVGSIYNWVEELKLNIEKIIFEKKTQNIYLCKNNEYVNV